MVGKATAGHQMELKLVQNSVVQYGSQWPLVAINHLRRGFSKLRCAVNIKYTPDVKDLAQKKKE